MSRLSRQMQEHRETSGALSETERLIDTLAFRLTSHGTEEINNQLKAENDRLKADNYKQRVAIRQLNEINHQLKMDNLLLLTRLRVAESVAKTRRVSVLADNDRSLMIKLLGMLGSEHQGERDNAARAIERLRRSLEKTWQELL